MKETIEKILKKYEDNKIEILLMFVFVVIGLAFGLSEVAEESVAHKVQIEQMSEAESETEAFTEPETEQETESETESLKDLEEALARIRLVSNGDFCVPMVWEQDRVTELYAGTEYGTWQILRTYRLCRAEKGFESYQKLSRIGIQLGYLKERPITELQAILEEKLDAYDGHWSVYVKNLGTNESFVINDRPMNSASVMKLFIMGTVYKAFDSGELERTEDVMALVHDMIEYSDNGDSNRLLYLLGNESYERGIAKVDAFIQEYGFSEMTVEYNGFNDPATNTRDDVYNQVSAKDCGKLLEDIYRRTWVNRRVSNEIEDMLLSQNTRYKIPAGLPEGVLCGNKTGEMSATENDAAIVYGEECDYILVVLSNNWSSRDNAIERIRLISAEVYEFLN